MTTASQGTVSAASSANIAHGVWPPLTAKWKLPLAATASRARSATNAAPARATASGSGRDSSSWCMSRSYSSFSLWPPNSLRIAASILPVNSPRRRDSKRSYRAVVMTGAGTPSSTEATTVQLPSPESETRPADSSSPGEDARAAWAERSRNGGIGTVCLLPGEVSGGRSGDRGGLRLYPVQEFVPGGHEGLGPVALQP